ncbi:putative transcriptional regulator [Streptomyces sp. 2333.5]|uniref:BlaI/MecI/CopY family transcriptional regulator n=1 Tax=unclassified Streptomyces TaxID=2593676 RepID=UPI00089B162A|nr:MULTISPECIES: BlaI/MecI/CopY family transcriptional regulator [unclassified Streptomyces]PJJ03047.1 putative transcriptional regulator [Streptomyces sp. 2333.5]SED60963.1 Predicted transcriptional regulator [Streptomyces sp. 2314.4]SEE27907.1 Predicted transcriptional regulator [Streptomyces sp. 2112.2]
MGGKSFGRPPGGGGNPGRAAPEPEEFDGGRERARRRGQGQLEAQVLAALHRAPGPAGAAWVQERLGGDLAYTTVMTILSRLHAKQAVTRERSGRAYLWSPAADEAGLAALRMRRVLDGEPDRDAVLTSFVSTLSAQDEQLLRTLLDRAAEAAEEAPATARAPVPDDAPAAPAGSGPAPGPTRHHPSDEARGG